MLVPGLSRVRNYSIFFLFLLAYTFFFQIYPNFISTNEFSRFLLTSAITDFQTVQIDKPIKLFGNSQDKAFYKGHYYSDKAIGVSLIGVPVYAVLKIIAAIFQITLPVKWILFFLKLFCVTIPTLLFVNILSKFWYEICEDAQTVAIATFLFLFGTIVFTYSVQFVSNSAAGCLLFLSFYYIYRGNKDREKSPRCFALAGMFAGIAILFEYPAFLLVPPLFGYLLWTAFRRVQFSWFVAGFTPFLLILLVYNYSIFGTPFDVTYHHMADITHQQEHGQGFLGLRVPKIEVLWRLLFGSERGLFYFSPVLLLSFPGLYFFYRNPKWKKEAVLFLVLILILVLFVSGMSNWPGGWAFGPRYLAPAIPFLMTGVFIALSDKSFRSGDTLSFLVFVLGLLSIIIITVGTITFPYPAPEMNDPLFTLSFPLFFRGNFSLNILSFFMHRSLGPAILYYTILLVTFLVLLGAKASMRIDAKHFLRWTGILGIVVSYLLLGFILSKVTSFDYYARASVCVYLGDYYNALNDLSEALKRNPDNNLRRLILLRHKQILELSSPKGTGPR